MKKALLFLAIAAAVAACDSSQKGPESDSTKTHLIDTGTKQVTTVSTKPESASNWTFRTDTDKMTSKERYFATVDATNKLDFEAPYDGGSTATVVLRNQNKTNEVMLEIDKGQFHCDITDGCTVNVRFDADKAMTFSAIGPSDGSSELLFISPSKKFINGLKKAKKMLIQAEFYESGNRTMEFNVDGLKWEH